MDWLKRPGFFQEEREFFVIVCRARGVLYGPLHRNTCLQGQRRSEFVRAAERIIRFVTLIIRSKEMKKTCVLGTYLPIALGVILFSTLIDAKEAQCFKCSRIEFRNATSATVLINPVTAPNDEIDVPWRKPNPQNLQFLPVRIRISRAYAILYGSRFGRLIQRLVDFTTQ